MLLWTMWVMAWADEHSAELRNEFETVMFEAGANDCDEATGEFEVDAEGQVRPVKLEGDGARCLKKITKKLTYDGDEGLYPWPRHMLHVQKHRLEGPITNEKMEALVFGHYDGLLACTSQVGGGLWRLHFTVNEEGEVTERKSELNFAPGVTASATRAMPCFSDWLTELTFEAHEEPTKVVLQLAQLPKKGS